MKIRIEIKLGKEVCSGFDVAKVITSTFKSFEDGADPLKVAESGPFFSPSTGDTIGSWEVVR